MTDLIRLSATQTVTKLRAGEITPKELLGALEARIAAVDGQINALPTLCFERAYERAARIETLPVEARGILCGLPIPIKDLADVAGVRTTHGSPIYADNIPETSAHIVERVETSGGIVYAKSNTPEFGAGGHTFNEVFPTTRNPWNTKMSAAGSSGGAAASLASGTAWLAHGSDMGGSLRNPASFCSVVGLRPSPGRVPGGPSADPFSNLGLEGPMARDVDDVALFLDAMCGVEPREPLSLETSSIDFHEAARERRAPTKVTFGGGLGITPVDPEVLDITRSAAARFSESGATVIEDHPDFSGTHEAFQTLRAFEFAFGLADEYRNHRDLLKPDVIWNIEKGQRLNPGDVADAVRLRGALTARVLDFMKDVDVMATPATIVPAFPIEQRYVEDCDGKHFDNYVDWLAIAFAITLTGLPAISIPCGFTAAGLPIGLQLVGKPRGEAALLSAAGVLQDILAVSSEPIDPRDGSR